VKNLLLIIILLSFNYTFAQVPEIDWMKRYGGISQDYLNEIIVTQDGGLFLSGSSNSGISGNKTQARIGGTQDYWVVKTDIHGTIEWQKTIGGGDVFGNLEAEVLRSGKQAPDGSYYLGGNSDSPIYGNKTVPNYGLQDYWIVKLDSEGDILWQANIGGTNYEECYSLEVTSDGGCIVGGFSQSGISGNKTESSRGGRDYYVVKLDSNGQIEWQKTYGGSGMDVLYSILVLENNEYLLSGVSSSNISGDKTENSKGGGDFWIIKINAAGSIIWQKTIGGNSADTPYSLVKVLDGFVISGVSDSDISFDKTQNSRGGSDYWLVKTDFEGNVIWDKTYGGDIDDFAFGLLSFSDERGFVLVGASYSGVTGDKTVVNYGEYNGWIIRTDENGELLWQKGIGGTYLDLLSQVVELPDKSILLGGGANSLVSGNLTVAGFNSLDYWLVKLAPEELSVNEVVSNDFLVYPNPTTKEANIKFTEHQENIKVIVYNALIQVVDKLEFASTSQVSFSINNSSGIYFVKMTNQDGKVYQSKIVKK
jgi:hypothetical protein